jgi:DNA-directed RNA polymerase I subunit RPA1
MVSISSSIQADPSNAIIRNQVQSIQFGYVHGLFRVLVAFYSFPYNFTLRRYYTDDEVRERSVVEVTSTLAFDPVTHTPLPNGLYDMKMGPIPGHSSTSSSLASSSCITCGRLVKDCTGHCGHIEFCVPIYHPMLISNLLTLCQCICRNCFRFRMSRQQLNIIQMKFHLLDTQQYDKYYQFDTILAAAIYQARNQNDIETEGLPNKLAATRAAAVAVDQVLRSMKRKEDRNHSLPSMNPSSSASLSQKSTYFEQLHNELCNETIKQLQSNTLRCSRCGAYSPKLRLDTSNKIFQCAMSKKYAQCNRMEGIVSFPSAIQYTLKKKNKGFYEDSNMYDSEDTERGTYDNEMGENDDDESDEGTESTVSATSKKQRDMYLPPSELQAMVKHIFAIEPTVSNCLFGMSDKYFMQCVAVLPNRFRPPMKVNTMMVEHVQTVALGKVLQANSQIRDQMATILQQNQSDDTNAAMTALSASSNTSSTIYQSWIELQTAVNIYMDSSKDPSASGSANTSSAGIRQILERKEGLFRKHMMGKRVNYACRSVISPDPYIGSNEIGIPKYFCTVLTYPTPVTQFNISELRVAVERGPNQYPGARWVLVPSSNGGAERVVDLSKMNLYQRRAISAQLLQVNKSNPKPYVVGRQLRDGDYVLMNRQVRATLDTFEGFVQG